MAKTKKVTADISKEEVQADTAVADTADAVKKRRGRPPKQKTETDKPKVVIKRKTASSEKVAQTDENNPEQKLSPVKKRTLKTADKAVKKTATKSVRKAATAARKPVSEKTPDQEAVCVVAQEENRQQETENKPAQPEYNFGKLVQLSVSELYALAEQFGVENYAKLLYDDLILAILRNQAISMGYGFGGGTLEIKPSENGTGFGFLRPEGLLPGSEDIYVSGSQIRRFGLRNGDLVWGVIRPPREGEQFAAILRIENVCYTDPELSRQRPVFEKLTPVFPNEKLKLETEPCKVATRIIDLFAPIGKGQRALVVAPPKAGKTTLLKQLANAITANHPEVIMMVVLIDERPEEVTDIARSVHGEIIASTFDRPAEEHIRVATLALDKAKRLAEAGKDVVLLLDSITRLARASNLVAQPSGRTLSGGMDPAALYFPKRFFGAARNIENGGSFTIIGTALVETGSRMDDVIYEEFKGTGNMEVQLSRKIAEQRIFPAIDIAKSSTRRDDLLIAKEDLQRLNVLRRKIVNMDEADILNMILERLRATKTNKEFLAAIRIN